MSLQSDHPVLKRLLYTTMCGVLVVLSLGSCVQDAGTGVPAPDEVARITVGDEVPELLVADLSGDGLDDLVVADVQGGAYPHYQGGIIYLLAGPIRSRDLASEGADLVLRGQEPFRRYGQTLAMADMDGDGRRDLVIASDLGQDGVSKVVLVSGSLRGEHPLEASAFLSIDGPPTLGQAVTSTDYNGDGTDDLVLSCPVRSEVYILLGPRTGHVVLPDNADAVIAGGTGALGWTMSPGRFGPNGTTRLAMAEPAREAVYVVPAGSLGRHAVEEIATATIRSSDSMDNLLGCEGITGLPGAGDRLVVRTRRADSEQIGAVFMLDGPIAGEVDVRRDSVLTLDNVHIGHTMSPAAGSPTLGLGPMLALGFPAQAQLPDSSLTGQVWVVSAHLSGVHDLSPASLGPHWTARAQDTDVSLLGNRVRFGALRRAGTADLVVVGAGTVVVYGWGG